MFIGMTPAILFTLVIAALSKCSGELQVGEYVYWKKADISAWHQYFPSRAMNEELLTIMGAMEAARTVAEGLMASLEKVVQYQAQELDTARFMMEGTSAQGCVQGISEYMNKTIYQEFSAYEDCTADVLPRLQRLYDSWPKGYNSYLTVYQRALDGIDVCAKTYPNKDSLARLQTCVDSYYNSYYKVANNMRPNVFDSPSMKVFTGTVIPCVQTAVEGVVSKGWKFLDMLVKCAKLSENVDAQAYQTEVSSGFSRYLTTNDLLNQTLAAQNISSLQVSQVEQEMLFYYDLQKTALEQYVIESRGQGYYRQQVYGYLEQYFNAVTSSSRDNPSSGQCVSAALGALNNIVTRASSSALQYDQDIVNNTKLLIGRVNNNFQAINSMLPSVGNMAIQSCFSQGYIFAEQTILQCYKLMSSYISISVAEVNATIVKDVDVLLGYRDTFFSTSALPCGDPALATAFLEAERTLYDLQRCLYINSGAKYAVTTPSSMLPV